MTTENKYEKKSVRGYRRCRMRSFIAISGCLSLFSASASAEVLVYVGSADTTLNVFQVESGSLIDSWSVPISMNIEVALMPFDSIELLGINVAIQQSVFEDTSQNFEFDFSLMATITGSLREIGRIGDTDRWITGSFMDDIDVSVSLDRIVFGQVSHFESQEFINWPSFDVVDIGGYPANVIYDKTVVTWTEFGRVFYDENKALSFTLSWPGDVTLSQVPEPTTLLLGAMAAVGLMLRRRCLPPQSHIG